MDSYQETFDTWNKVAALYEEKFMDLDFYNQTYDFICNTVVKQNARILDLGCGPGNITKYLLAQRPDFIIDGIDVAPKMIDLAKKNNPDANFYVMDSRSIAELKTKYDAIICGFCVPYLSEPDIQKLIIDVKGLLNEKGFFYLSFVEGDPEQSGFQIGSTGNRVYFYYHTLESIQAKLLDAGVKSMELFKIDYRRSATETEVHTVVTVQRA